eukprot:NODE_1957_length_1344_cov_457.176834_g1774_i0.p2 GENE.NODE_1957_length_1344_cov_457.176834_g1774_i0~~NODE_1957_length_1344_cov_457.176834_g1774_i0.p2  ORF type:complete len:395 (+),score=108.60 NODE_1957_length_1344_cov_457.176834_g1774_i0:45-1229(+)
MSFLLILVSCSLALATVHFQESFDGDWESRWTHSSAKSDYGKFVGTAGKFFGDEEINKGIQTSQDARFYALSAQLAAPFTSKDKPLVLQFSAKHEQNIDCGGGYLKVLPSVDGTAFNGDSKYYIMFGPDICGATKKIHFIFHYKGQNLLWKKEPRCETDTLTHVYTAIVNPDGTYEVLVDNEKRESGKLEEDWDFLKPKTIPDPEDKKPEDWVDEAEMADPEDRKPDNWDDEPETIADPDATQPDDWEEEEDGEWEAPMIANPNFKGEWKPKTIPNPAYKGVWKPRDIPNPEYEADENLHVFEDIAAVGFDLWQVKSGTIFDNIILTDSVEEAQAFYESTTGKTKVAEKEAFDKAEAEERAKEEEERKKQAEEKSDDDEDEDEDEEGEDKHDEL